ncbi:hypothetical protein DFS34DRAFT_230252 [Phlyctochytrium arcticum]|nr:hypothetical protein DFS34DRAFT_230252 [Phlyctochytrium arcticum]
MASVRASITSAMSGPNNTVPEGGVCCGCAGAVDEEQADGGNLINFSGSIYHIQCFKCSSCSTPIDYERNVVLLSEDNKALCVNCSYKCKVCGLAIVDEAISTGEDNYHMSCFRCQNCSRPIEDLTFTQLGDTLLCVDCHRTCSSTSSMAIDQGSLNRNGKPKESPETKSYESMPSRRSEASLADVGGSGTYVMQVEQDLKERTRQLTITENNLSRIKTTSKRALEEFQRITDAYQKEFYRRQQAEAAVETLRSELTRTVQESSKNARNVEQASRLNLEVKALHAQRSILEADVKQMSERREELSMEVTGLLTTKNRPATAGYSEDAVHGERRKQVDEMKEELEKIKHRFKEEVESLQKERDALRIDCEGLRSSRDELFAKITEMTSDVKQLELRYAEITKQIVASADSQESTSKPLVFVGQHSGIDELTREVSTDDLARAGNTSSHPYNTPSSNFSHSNYIPLAVAQRQATARPAGPRKDSRGEISTSHSDPNNHVGAVKKDRWTKEWKSTMKDTKTRLKKVIPHSKIHNDEAGADAGSAKSTATIGGDTGSNSSLSGMFKSKKSMSASESDLAGTEISSLKAKCNHSFHVHTYRSPRKCEHCADTLWGKELRCELCSFHVHQKCSTQYLNRPPPPDGAAAAASTSDAPFPVFGTDLCKLLEYEGGTVPHVVVRCITAVEARGMTAEGIYRKSGPLTQVNKLISIINKGEPYDDIIQEESEVDIMAVTSVLKQFFRELPEPLLSSELYEELTDFIQTQTDEESKLQQIEEMLHMLPPGHYSTLEYLIMHLDRVQQHACENLMTPSNLGVVFGPSLVRPATQEVMLDMARTIAKTALVEFLVRHARDLFASDLLNTVTDEQAALEIRDSWATDAIVGANSGDTTSVGPKVSEVGGTLPVLSS